MTRPGLIVGAAIVVAAAVGTAAWLMLPPEIASPPPLSEAAKADASAATIAVPESASPPEVTSADFGQAKPPPATAAGAPTAQDKNASSVDWPALPIEEVRDRANAEDVTAMEELARRLVQGIGVAKDQQAAAGWLLRAAQRGSGAIRLQCRRDVRAWLRGRARFDQGHRMVPQGRRRQRADGQAQPRPAAARRKGRAAQRQGGGRAAAVGGPSGNGRLDVHAGRHLRARRRGPQGPGDRPRLVRHHRRVRTPDQSRRRERTGQDGEPTCPGPAAHPDAGRTRARPAVRPGRIQADRRNPAASQARGAAADRYGRVASARFPASAAQRCVCIGACGLAQGHRRSDPCHPAGPGRSQVAARQARWRVGPDDPQRHPRFPAQPGDARDRRSDRRRVRGAARRDQGRGSEG